LVAAGETLSPATLGLLAFVGCARLSVYRRPRVAVVATGSELVGVEATPAHGQIRNSNIFTLAGLVAQAGGELCFSRTVPDDRDALRRLLVEARHPSRPADLLVTTGGASAGERDLVKGLLAELGATFHFRQVAMRPGKPIGFAVWDGLPVVVLPGNPAAAFVGFQEFVRPALARLAGRKAAELPALRARLRGRASSKAGRRYVLLAQLEWGPGGFEVAPLPNQCSVLVRSAAEANALILLPEGPAGFQPGDWVDVQVLDWDRVVAGTGVGLAPAVACSRDFSGP
jgi:molybdopterin molybdotransferase